MHLGSFRRWPALIGAGGLLLLAGCVSYTQQAAGPPNPPPPIPVETVPKPPVSEQPLLWQPGHWDWTGSSYVWQQGAWIPRAGHGTEWQDGYWTSQGGSWVWTPGHWL